MSDSCGLQPARLLCPWDSPGKNPGMGCHFLLQGIFTTQESNPGLLHCRQILYQLSYKGSPKEMFKVIELNIWNYKTTCMASFTCVTLRINVNFPGWKRESDIKKIIYIQQIHWTTLLKRLNIQGTDQSNLEITGFYKAKHKRNCI